MSLPGPDSNLSAAEWCNLGASLHRRGQMDDAIVAYRKSIAMDSGFAEAYYNLATALGSIDQVQDAVSAYRLALNLNPDFPECYNNLGNLLRRLGELDEACELFQRAIKLRGDFAEAHNNLGALYREQGDADLAIECFRRAIEIKPSAPDLRSNLLYSLHFHSAYSAEKIFQESRRWSAQHELPLEQNCLAVANDGPSDRRLRVGYVSPDFRTHSAACFLLPVLNAHHAEQVEVFCYSNVKSPDASTERFQKLNVQWRDISRQTDQEAAKQIQHDRIDILVDLTLHMARNRLLLFARKPAPIQVTWLGYPGTTGLRAIDYRLTDNYLDPPGGDESCYSERSIHLPHSFWCYSPLIQTPEVNRLPALQSGRITFGSLNNFAKVSPATMDLWISVLHAVPDSRLLLQSPPGRIRDDIRARFQNHDVSGERIEFVARLEPAEYFAMYHKIDIALDTFPYNGHTTTLDALWMGVPVISLAGETAVSRGGVSILSNAGIPEFIARDSQQCVRIVQMLSANLTALAHRRCTLRAQLQQSPLMNADRFAVAIETAYREMCKR